MLLDFIYYSNKYSYSFNRALINLIAVALRELFERHNDDYDLPLHIHTAERRGIVSFSSSVKPQESKGAGLLWPNVSTANQESEFAKGGRRTAGGCRVRRNAGSHANVNVVVRGTKLQYVLVRGRSVSLQNEVRDVVASRVEPAPRSEDPRYPRSEIQCTTGY